MATGSHPRGRPSNEELIQRGAREVIAWLERVESQHFHLVVEYNTKMRDMARIIDQHRQEIAQLKEWNTKLAAENEDLRNMCCFLDDERERGQKLMGEWRRFGKYTASILNHEVHSYRDKLTKLEHRQNDILSNVSSLRDAPTAKPDLLEATPTPQENDGPVAADDADPTNQQKNIAENVADAFKVLELHEHLEKDPMSDKEKALVRDMCNVVWNKLENHYNVLPSPSDRNDSENKPTE